MAVAHQRTGGEAPAAAPHAIRVLVVDDSAVMRAIFHRTLDPCPDITIVGQAASAARALDLLGEAKPDLILLDLEMPQLDGLAALPLLLERAAGARVLVVSSACGNGCAKTVEALRLGAADVLAKPEGMAFAGSFATTLAERIRRLARPAPLALLPTSAVKASPARPAIVGVAASTGGVHALCQLLGGLPRDFAAPILVTQHLPPPFMPFFAAQIGEATGRRTRVADTGMLPNPGEILIAPGHAHLTLARTGALIHTRLVDEPAPSGCRPSADPMLASLARLYGHRACGVILSGMGRDGAEGARALVEAGAAVLAQDAASSVVWGMPGVVARAGLTQAVLPPDRLAAVLAGSPTAEARPWN